MPFASNSARIARDAARLAALVALASFPARAQTASSIHGRVTDAESGAPVVAARVEVVGTRLGAATENDGRYAIRGVPSGEHTVRVVRLGYAPASRSVSVTTTGDATLDFTLTRTALRLDQVVTTATGDESRREVGNAITTLNADSIAKVAPVTNLEQMLTARAAGVQVFPGLGLAGGSSIVRIRGYNSVSLSNDPLWVIDGIRMSSGQMNTSWSISGNLMTKSINPDDIESLEIIKGPSATALYGTQAANGVVVVKTKRGQAGAPRWTVYAEDGRNEQAAQWPDNWRSWGHNIDRTTGKPLAAVVQCRIANKSLGLCTVDSITRFNPLTNPETSPYDELGTRRLVGTQVSGGSERSRFFVSAEQEHEVGPYTMPDAEIARITTERGTAPRDDQVHPNALDQVNLRANYTAVIGRDADLTVSSMYTDRRVRFPFASGYFQGLQYQALTAPGFRNVYGGYSAQYLGDMMSVEAPESDGRLVGSMMANWRPLSWLSAHGTAGIDRSNGHGEIFAYAGEGPHGGFGSETDREGEKDQSDTHDIRYTVDLGASATWQPRASLQAKTTLGAQWHKDDDFYNNLYATGLGPGNSTSNAASQQKIEEYSWQTASYGAFVEEGLAWRDRLYFTVGGRTDRNSTFGVRAGTTIYPRASVSWVLSDEPFLKKVEGIDDLRLRAAWGRSGTQLGSTDALTLFNAGSVTYQGENLPTLRLSQIGNPTAQPEVTTETEVGLDLGLWQKRLGVELTYFNKVSRNGVLYLPLAPSIGGPGYQLTNLARVRNAGVELGLDVEPLRTRAVAWNIHLTGSHIRNRVLTLSDAPVGFSTRRTVAGYPFNGFWARPITGWTDANGDGILTASEVQVDTAWRFVGPSAPVNLVGMSNTLRLFADRVAVSALLDYHGGGYRWWQTEKTRCSGGNCRAVNDPTTPLADQAAAIAATTAAFGNTDFGFLKKDEFLTLRELSVTFMVPHSMLRMLRAPSGSLVLSGRNLRALSQKYPGTDPEGVPPYGLGASNEQVSAVPPLRYWIARLNLTF